METLMLENKALGLFGIEHYVMTDPIPLANIQQLLKGLSITMRSGRLMRRDGLLVEALLLN